MASVGYFILSLRPKQWIKNVFIFAPMVFSLHQFEISGLWQSVFVLYVKNSVIAFFLFCLITGAIYVFNDAIDRRVDQNHPEKRLRPIASGKIGVTPALIFAAVLLVAVLLVGFFFSRKFFNLSLVYVGLNILYSVGLKEVVIVDIMMVALGFVLRVMVGGAVNGIVLSPWILISTFLLSIFLALIKRRQELLKLQPRHAEFVTRKTLLHYTVTMIDQMISISTATCLIAYIMYVLSPEIQQKFHTPKLYYTVPFVIFGIFRYLFLSYAKGEGESPSEIIYTDLPFTLNLIFWVAVFIFLVIH